jgi:serine/threonine-protein kinase
MGETNSSETNSSPAENQKTERQVGSYILEQKLGEGGMAEVWKARHQVLGTYVAIKFLSAGYAGVPDVEQRFLGEGKKQARLFHPNIVSAYDFIYADGRSYLIMKFIEGESLDELLFRLQAPMPLLQVLAISTDVLHALEYAHTQNVVHRDIKPSNLMIEKGERALVMDFGVAMVVGEKRVTRVGMAIGTPHYMSPEQILGSPDIDRRADIYSFGCVLYQMLTGKAPFEAAEGEDDTEFIIQDKHVRQQPVPPRQWNPYIPEHIERAVLRCLEKKAADRFVSCQDLLTALTNPPVEEPKPRSNTVIETVPSRTSTVVEQVRPRRETVIESVPARAETIVETGTKATPTAVQADVLRLSQQPPVAPTQTAPRPPRDLSILWLVCTALISASLVGGIYLYLHRQKPASIVDQTPVPVPGPDSTTPKPPPGQAETLPDGSSTGDQPQPPVNPPVTKPDDTPVQNTPDKPVDTTPPHPTSDPPPSDTSTTPPTQPETTPSDTPETYTPAPAKPPAPQRHYAGEGNLIWSGQVDKNQIIQISGTGANIGNIAGDPFPGGGVPIQVSVNSDRFAVISQPNPLNQFSQISLRSTMKGNVSIVVHWKVLSNE